MVIDMSGSMHHMVTETVGGFNTFVKDRNEEEGRAWLSLTTFDTKIVERYHAWGTQDLPKLTENVFKEHGGGTALNDAIGSAISRTDEWVKNNQWFDGKHLVVIMTDGMENSSQNFNTGQVKELVQKKEAEGWQFIYMGAGIDAFHQGGANYGLSKSQTVSYDASGPAQTANTEIISYYTRSLRGRKTDDTFTLDDFNSQTDNSGS
jgi:uncharacterized protein YegL